MCEGEMISNLREYGESVIRSIPVNDPRISGAVQLTFNDRTQAVIQKAFAELAGDWLFVFSQTDGYFLYRKSDVLKWTAQSMPTATGLSHQPVARGPASRAA